MSGDLILVSAPSGAGKSTLIRGMLDRLVRWAPVPPPDFSVSHTTRPPRSGEVDGREYHFVDVATFERLIAEDGFVEHARVHGNYYGTSKMEVLPRLAAGRDVVLDIDVQGAAQVLARYPAAVSIFIMAPSFPVLAERLEGRGSDSPEVIARRLAVARAEMEKYAIYQYVILNDEAARASDVLAAIVLARRHQRGRMEERVGQIFATFPQNSG
jgi:guanylate kinase